MISIIMGVAIFILLIFVVVLSMTLSKTRMSMYKQAQNILNIQNVMIRQGQKIDKLENKE